MKTTIFLSCIAILTLVHVSTLSQQSINDECITLRFHNDIPSSPSINDKIVDLPLPFAKNVQATKKRKKAKKKKEKKQQKKEKRKKQKKKRSSKFEGLIFKSS